MMIHYSDAIYSHDPFLTDAKFMDNIIHIPNTRNSQSWLHDKGPS